MQIKSKCLDKNKWWWEEEKMIKKDDGFLSICILYKKIAGVALKVIFWQRINLTNFTLKLKIEKINNGCNQ